MRSGYNVHVTYLFYSVWRLLGLRKLRLVNSLVYVRLRSFTMLVPSGRPFTNPARVYEPFVYVRLPSTKAV